MRPEFTLFISTFTTLLAIINPLEALPVFLKLLEGKDLNEHRAVARQSCVYAVLLMLFFLLFGTLILRLFGVPLSMVRIVGGIILMRIGFQLFSASSDNGSIIPAAGADQGGNIAFVPLALPLMCGPGAIATILGMTTLIKHSEAEFQAFVAIALAILTTMFITYLCLVPMPGN
jgi:multiple antibiotic resistance protein